MVRFFWVISRTAKFIYPYRKLFQTAIEPTVEYDIVTAYKEWNTAQFTNMAIVTKAFLNDKLPGEIVFWASTEGEFISGHGPNALS
jgi:hypothetical protein